MNKIIMVTGFALTLAAIFWSAQASRLLAPCLRKVAQTYALYPRQYQQQLITQQEYQKKFLAFQQDTQLCQMAVLDRTHLPLFWIDLLTIFTLEGHRIPNLEDLQKSLNQ